MMNQQNTMQSTLDPWEQQIVDRHKQLVLAQILTQITEQLNLPASSTHGTIKSITSHLYDIVQVIHLISKGADLETIRQAVDKIQSEQIVDQLTEQLKSVNDDSGRVQQLVRAIYKFSRESEQLEPINLNRTIEDTLKLLDPCLNRGERLPRIKIIRRYDPQLPAVEGYLSGIRQTLFSLIHFSIVRLQNRDRDRITTSRPVPRSIIQIYTCRSDASEIELRISDNGPTLPIEEQRQLFKLHEANSLLGMSNHIIQLHQGGLSCSSNAAQGIELVARLPLQRVL